MIEPISIDGATSRFLSESEHSEPNHAPTLPWMIEAQPGHTALRKCVELLAAQRARVYEGITRYGALLLRGFEVPTGTEMTTVLADGLGMQLDDNFDLEPAQRKHTSARSFESDNGRTDVFMGPHTEMFYSWWRPRFISFHCELAALEFGETPLLDFRAVLRGVDPSVRRRFEHTLMVFERQFPRDYIDGKYRGDVAAFEVALRRGGYAFEHAGATILAKSIVPCVVRHPVTSETILNFLWFWGDRGFEFFVETTRRFPKRAVLGADKLAAQPRVPNGPHDALMTFDDGKDFSRDEIAHLVDLSWKSATWFPWRAGDIVVIDNCRIGHSKSPHRGPRRLNAALGNMYNLRDQLVTPFTPLSDR